MATKTATIERRFAPIEGVELRADDDGKLRFRGHAAVFNSLTDIGWFREQVAPGAFRKTIKDGADVRFLFNHDPDSVMARTTNGTLTLTEDKRGLLVEAELDPDDLDVQRITPKLRSGNVSQMSFAFRVVKEDVEDDPEDGGSQVRTLREVELFDVSPVTFPAYPETDGQLRDALGVVERYAASMGLTDLRAALEDEVPTDEDFDALISKDSPDDLRGLVEGLRAKVAELEAILEPEQEPSGDTPLHSFDADKAKRLVALRKHKYGDGDKDTERDE